ncbi:hypothetical protein [Demequina lutea]|uniref:Uncharacterized protein n=1 Tax=Demequina lutea TaxID=431489 RepID=A0A7Y9Z949_9MICO|nr:hypothetical protein [Demequina lutea]NYI40278.1 hypothetical protein [Demequina lutea]
MSSESTHEAFALLLRHHQSKRTALGTAAVRTIRRRVATRWTGRLGALVVVGILGAVALDGASGGTDGNRHAAVGESPISTPTIGFVSATFPLTGGPEFIPASATLRCGDPAPTPHPVDHDLSLTLRVGTALTLGDQLSSDGPPLFQAVVRSVTTADQGTVATSGIDFLVIQDGIIRGMISGGGVILSQNLKGGTVTVPRSQLLIDGAFCSDGQHASPANIGPGAYDVIAIGRVFSTAESVALAQALGDTINTMYLNPNNQADPTAVYLPGIYNCKQARPWRAALRGCLPEVTDNATVDEARGTVTVVYHAKDLVDEFSAVLVSDPLTVELVSGQGTAMTAAAA